MPPYGLEALRSHELMVLSEEALEQAHRDPAPGGTPAKIDVAELERLLARVKAVDAKLRGYAPTA